MASSVTPSHSSPADLPGEGTSHDLGGEPARARYSLVHSATLQTFSVATNEYRGANGERTEYHACVAWDRLAEICGQFLSNPRVSILA